MFAPSSQGRFKTKDKLTLKCAQDVIPNILLHLQASGKASRREILNVEQFATNSEGVDESISLSNRLAELFKLHGSDKSSVHDYHKVYGKLIAPLANLDREVRVLEIGLGSSNAKYVSNMGRRHEGGGSLRAFRDLLPQMKIFGADIDSEMLFEEDRITTQWVDQLNRQTLKQLFGGENDFDLVIDDGLHSIDANFATYFELRSRLRIGGHLVIEDVHEAALDFWQLMLSTCGSQFDGQIIRTKAAFLVVFTRRAS